MTPSDDPWRAYSAEILSFSLAGREPVEPLPTPDPTLTRRRAESLERMLAESGKAGLVLLGVGTGALAAELAERVDDLLVCDLSPERVRDVLASGRLDPGRVRLFADASPWAHLVFLAGRGLTTQTRLFAVNPEGTAAERKERAALQKLWLSAAPRQVGPVRQMDGQAMTAPEKKSFSDERAGSSTVLASANSIVPAHSSAKMATIQPPVPGGSGAAPSLAAAAILRPDEPGLEEFFAALPTFLEEIVLVWDQPGDAPLPNREAVSRLAATARLTEIRRPLAADFAAQRNAMLEACAADWVLYLDGDERLAPGDWERAAALAASGLAEAWIFPRLTFWPEAGRVQAGYGLWPDPQLRLFRRGPDLRFERPVHERLEGLRGPIGLALDLPVLHESYLRKDRERIEAKLRLFDEAGGGFVRHRRNDGYPSLPQELLAPSGDRRFVSCLLLGVLP